MLSLILGCKTESNKLANKLTEFHRHGQQCSGYWREGRWGEIVKAKGSQIYGNGRRFDFG